jgi:hypothetical protein
MKKTSVLTFALLTCGLMSSPAIGQGLIGVQYAELDGGYLRFSDPVGTIDGWTVGGSLNTPLTKEERFGFDLLTSANYLRISDDDFRVQGYGLAGVVRGYALVDPRFLPYADLGLVWSRSRVRFAGDTETSSGFSLPIGVGIEFLVGPFSIAPFFEYQIGLSNDIDDSWSIGAKAAYWVNSQWGLTFEGAYTEFDDDFDGWSAIAGVVFAF